MHDSYIAIGGRVENRGLSLQVCSHDLRRGRLSVDHLGVRYIARLMPSSVRLSLTGGIEGDQKVSIQEPTSCASNADYSGPLQIHFNDPTFRFRPPRISHSLNPKIHPCDICTYVY